MRAAAEATPNAHVGQTPAGGEEGEAGAGRPLPVDGEAAEHRGIRHRSPKDGGGPKTKSMHGRWGEGYDRVVVAGGREMQRGPHSPPGQHRAAAQRVSHQIN